MPTVIGHHGGRSALGKGWRWVGEMVEIARTFAAAGLPDGFHEPRSAARRTFRSRPKRRCGILLR